MKQFTCLNCGTTGNCERADKQFCSKRCYHQYHRNHEVKPKNYILPCLHNEGVECSGGDCSTCGWHPDVAAARKAELEEVGSMIPKKHTGYAGKG